MTLAILLRFLSLNWIYWKTCLFFFGVMRFVFFFFLFEKKWQLMQGRRHAVDVVLVVFFVVLLSTRYFRFLSSFSIYFPCCLRWLCFVVSSCLNTCDDGIVMVNNRSKSISSADWRALFTNKQKASLVRLFGAFSLFLSLLFGIFFLFHSEIMGRTHIHTHENG